jgi:hypothetical protein
MECFTASKQCPAALIIVEGCGKDKAVGTDQLPSRQMKLNHVFTAVGWKLCERHVSST